MDMFIKGYGRFFRLTFRTLFRSRGTYAQLSPGRFLVLLFWLPTTFIHHTIHWFFFMVDAVLFPGYRKVEVREPVFLLGVPRSGTTLLQRTMAQDTEGFTGFQLWEMMMAPSITEKYIFTGIGKLDRLLGGFGKKLVLRIEKKALAELSKIHPTGFFKAEEDELLLVMAFSTLALVYPFPFVDEFLPMARFDTEVEDADRKMIMKFYKRCIQRHLYFHGPEKRFISKNPLATGKILSLRETFPDAKIICNVRTPTEAVPSMLSLTDYYWRAFKNNKDVSDFRELLLTVASYFYSYPIEVLDQIPEDGQAVVQFEDLKHHLKDTITGLYTRLNIPITEAYLAKLDAQEASSKKFVSQHAYQPDLHGLTQEQIEEVFHLAYDHYGYARSVETTSQED